MTSEVVLVNSVLPIGPLEVVVLSNFGVSLVLFRLGVSLALVVFGVEEISSFPTSIFKLNFDFWISSFWGLFKGLEFCVVFKFATVFVLVSNGGLVADAEFCLFSFLSLVFFGECSNGFTFVSFDTVLDVWREGDFSLFWKFSDIFWLDFVELLTPKFSFSEAISGGNNDFNSINIAKN